MKKLFVIMLALALALSLAACGGGGKAGANGGGSPSGGSGGVSAGSGSASAPDTNSGGGGNQPAAGKAKDYAGAYEQATAIQEAFSKIVTDAIDNYSGDNADNVKMIMAGLELMSMDLAFTASFSEDPQTLQGVSMALSFLGVKDAKAVRNAAHDYTVTFTDQNGAAAELSGKFDPGSGGLQMISKTGGTLSSFYEFVPLGGDKYAYQTDGERAVIGYAGGNVTSFVYAATNQGVKYDVAKDGIFPSGSGANEAWVTALGADSLSKIYNFDGTTLKIDAVPMMGDRLQVEIPV